MSTRVSALGVGLLAMLLVPNAKSSDLEQQARVTINSPIEVPGSVLGAGTYVFKVDETSTGQPIVQIFDQDQRHLFANTLAMPVYREKVTGEPVFQFEERAADAPPALHTWFFGADDRGVQFLYSADKKN